MQWTVASALASLAYVFALSRGSLEALLVALAVGLAVPAAVVLFRQQLRFHVNTYNCFTTIAVGSYLLLNIWVNHGHYQDGAALAFAVIHTSGFVAYLFVLDWIASNLDVRGVLSKVALILVPLALVAAASSARVSGRLDPFGLQPNWWGELMVALSITALGINAVFARAGIYVLAALVLFLVQSRSGMVGWAIVIVIEAARAWKETRVTGRLGLVLLVVSASGIALMFAPLSTFISSKVLLLNNPYRGLGTGLTGRIRGWELAWAAFLKSPVLGRGIGTFNFVHNGFLQLLSEGGVVLGGMVAIFVGRALRRAWLSVDYIKLASLLAVAGYMAFQPRMLNLDLTAIIFWLAMRDWRVPGVRVAPAAVRHMAASPETH